MRKRFIIILLLLCLAASLSVGVVADFGDFARSSDYGGSGGGDWDGGDILFDFAATAIFIIILVIWFLVDERKKKKNGSAGDNSDAQAGMKPIRDYYALDPAFNDAAFREKLSNLYVQMQKLLDGKGYQSAIKCIKFHFTFVRRSVKIRRILFDTANIDFKPERNTVKTMIYIMRDRLTLPIFIFFHP